jgi:NAD+ synthase (glutamine-hydrolysing)
VRLALCQINPTVGDLSGNAQLIREGIEAALREGAQLVLFPELALTGYPPEDLLLREHFLSDTGEQLQELARAAVGIVAIVGFPERILGALRGPAPGSPGPVATVVYNSAAVLAGGEVESVYRKVHLPNYGVFDEQRYFKSGDPNGGVITVAGPPNGPTMGEPDGRKVDVMGAKTGVTVCKVGVTVCEDLWVAGPPASAEAHEGAKLIVNISASPYHAGKGVERERLFARRARETGAHVAFCAMVGGQDELVFDGHSFVLDPDGETIARGAQFEEDMIVCDVEVSVERDSRAREEQPSAPTPPPSAPTPPAPAGSPSRAGGGAREPSVDTTQSEPSRSLRQPIGSREEEVYASLQLGLRDYVEKNGFGAVVLGLSGGIDSALVACLAVDALGAERVNVAIMPSPYSSSATQDDARALARALGVRSHELEIERAMDAYAQTLSADFEGLPEDLTEENLQARIRGNLLMALSNKFGWLVLTTGNKSEMSVGYTTLYGDLAGGFAVIKDVPKTLVYGLAHWRNDPDAAAGVGERATRARHAPSAVAAVAAQSGVTTTDTPRTRAVVAPMPVSILERSPSAELREDQTDQDSLPPYEVLDRILHGYIEMDRSREQLVAEGLPAHDVELATRLVDGAEYKRRQAPPGIKITERAFGRDRRMPITNAYRG